MSSPTILTASLLEHPIRSLCLIWAAWKLFLLAAVLLSPGPGYDTSSNLLLRLENASTLNANDSIVALDLSTRVAEKLTRWDALYFFKIAQRGYLFEQEWAFGWGWTRLLSYVVIPTSAASASSRLLAPIFIGIAVAHLSHLASVTLLYRLAIRLVPSTGTTSEHAFHKAKVAFIAAALHIVSPAGVFLSAPYGESLFSALNFAGLLLYAHSTTEISPATTRKWHQDAALLGAGAFLMLATTVRSNGLIGGALFAMDLVLQLHSLLLDNPAPRTGSHRRGHRIPWRHLTSLVLGGGLVFAGFVMPQALAFLEYCGGGGGVTEHAGPIRPWCTRLPPSIYTFVQQHYWNVGFLRYWTASNIPLFLLATPLLYLLLGTALSSWRDAAPLSPSSWSSSQRPSSELRLRARLAIPQALLALAALTSFHVQIVTRLASGYPVWYVCVAEGIVGLSESSFPSGSRGKEADRKRVEGKYSLWVTRPEWVVRFMVAYAVVQAGLYASFLPPA